MAKNLSLAKRRAQRSRSRLRKTAYGKMRLSVFRSQQHIHAQVIDDDKGHTLVAASSLEKDMRAVGKGCDVEAAQRVGKLLAERALEAGVKEVIFDRGASRYHGRIKALADAAREGGLTF